MLILLGKHLVISVFIENFFQHLALITLLSTFVAFHWQVTMVQE